MKLIKIVLGLFLAASSSLSLAVVELQLEGGQNDSTYKYKDNSGGTSTTDPKIKGTDVGATALFAPWKAPVGLGISYVSSSGKGSENNIDYTMNATKTSAALGAWLPSPVVRPFVNFKYIVSGAETLEAKVTGASVKAKGDLTGYSAELGLGFKLAPMVNLFLSFAQNSEVYKLKTGEVTVGSVTATGDYTNGETYTISGSVISLGFGLSL